ncbi:MAG: caspase family protein [Paludibacteraceae bacterium]|nr:caspase family protein [Paludibacteraceae bacterium]
MKRLLFTLCVFFLSFPIGAQTKDAATVYSEFQQLNTILKTTDVYSEEHQMAVQRMLQLYPMLQHHAASFSQKGNSNNAVVFAKAYVDMALMPEFQDMHLEKSESYPTMVYFVASNYYNRKEYALAERYMERYIECGEQKNRKNVFLFLAQTQAKLGQIEKELNTLSAALVEYPTDQNMLALSINTRMENGWYEDALQYVNLALQARPGDSKLASLKGQCLEGMGQYEQAANIYAVLAGQQKTLNIYKHYALNLFNCAVSLNTIAPERSTDYFQRAIPILKQVVVSDPTSVQYTTSLALAYLYTDQYEELSAINGRLRAMGAAEVSGGQVGADIALMSSDLQRPSSARPAVAANTLPVSTSVAPVSQPKQEQKPKSKTGIDFTLYAQNYIEKEINQWQQKDPFETIDEYTQRVTEETRNEKVNILMNEAKQEYLAKYQKQIRRSDFSLQPYDAENGVFLINSKYGDIILPVAREDNEARQFASNWMSVRIENPVLDIAGDELIIRSMDFVAPNGKAYRYSDQDEAKYTQADIQLQFNDIDYAGLGSASNGAGRQKVSVQKQKVTVGESDIDVGIPETKNVRSKTFAFIIGNENYQAVTSVPFALNDARSMQKYFNKTLGIPDDNIRLYEDATFGKILGCVRDIKSIANAYNGDIDIIFYYAGHGIPDEKSKSAYLLPVDADGTQTDACYSIGRLYTELGQLGAKSVLVMMDACFSGSQRGDGMIASARGVALKVKPDEPQGKMVTLSAATGEETAYPYEEKQHGMFSYFVMKHLQETKGKTTLGALADYVMTQVRQQSVVINHKSQTPTVSASSEASEWRRWNMNK